MSTYLTTRWGRTVSKPNLQDLETALVELSESDGEHPDCWLASKEGWTLSVFQSGLVIFENIETGEGPWHIKSVKDKEAIELWLLLQSNELAAIQSKPWLDGYGNT